VLLLTTTPWPRADPVRRGCCCCTVRTAPSRSESAVSNESMPCTAAAVTARVGACSVTVGEMPIGATRLEGAPRGGSGQEGCEPGLDAGGDAEDDGEGTELPSRTHSSEKTLATGSGAAVPR